MNQSDHNLLQQLNERIQELTVTVSYLADVVAKANGVKPEIKKRRRKIITPKPRQVNDIRDK